jgi:pimeloyl-ACP methyl ester carboxylesterase
VAAPLATVALQAQSPAPAPAPSNFTIFVRAVPIGTEQVVVERAAAGWRITGNGRVGAPLNIVTRRLEVQYDPEWRPIELVLDATVGGRVSSIRTLVSGTTVRSETSTDGTPTAQADTIDSSTVLLSNPFFAPYEALAARVSNAAEGAVIPVYDVEQRSLSVTVGRSATERIQTLARVIDARRTRFSMSAPGRAPLEAELWSDESGRLLRLTVPTQSLDVVREDIASVSARRVVVSRPGDEQLRVPARGFSIAGTISKPVAAQPRHPAVVLVGGSEPADRDEVIAGIPVFGELAGSLADAGFLVARYDRRGVGQSGGRPESATVADYAEDVLAVVRALGRRPDVDRQRVAVLGHGEGGPVAMIAAERDDRVTALVLVAAIGMTGTEHNLAQVRHAVGRLNTSEAEKQSTIDLQKRIQNAVLTGKGWEEVPEPLRLRADTPWFESFLRFDPARLMRGISQPLLAVHGLLDKQVDPANADLLVSLARARRNPPPSEVVKIPGINHLLVPATTGEIDEYPLLSEPRVSPAVTEAIVSWLKTAWPVAGG